ncbi:uncharacterized protein LOC124898921 [Capsicum annuum]|uniref:uncharacterized protein LOC124898921 n=1 Tax=Capsicum annuum TaxID=4072 RepID=UPI001FB09E29|nr:uncharacterized protein LOC124898921 [Capsicum annuum]
MPSRRARRNNERPQPVDPLGETVSQAEFRATFQALAQAITANAQANTQATIPPSLGNNFAVAWVRDFMRMNPPEFFGSKVGEDPQMYLDEARKITQIMHVTEEESVKLAAYGR